MKRKNPDSLYYREMRRAQKGLFEWAIAETGAVNKAAELLGLNRKHLHDLIKECGADVHAAKSAAKQRASQAALGAQQDPSDG